MSATRSKVATKVPRSDKMSARKVGSIKVPQSNKSRYNLWKKKMLLYIRASNPEYVKLILVDSMDDDMSHQIMVYESAKHMWETIELLMEGTEDVRKNRLDILTSQYEAFKALPGESITQVFERLNKLLNELSIHGKTYPQREVNMNFMMVLPQHLENKASSVCERVDFETMTLEKLYGKLKTHEMEQEQRKIIYGGGTTDCKNAELLKTTTLVASGIKELDITAEKPKSKDETLFEAEMDDGSLTGNLSDYYTIEEMQGVEDPTMENLAGMFSNIRFRRKQGFRGCGSNNRGQRSSSSSGSGKLNRQRIKAKLIRRRKKDSGSSRKYPVKSYIDEGKSWDDTDDEKKQYGNLARMIEFSSQDLKVELKKVKDENDKKNTGRSKTVSPPKARKVAPITKHKSKSVGASESDKEIINDKALIVKPGIKQKKAIWILDSGCSRHMTGDRALLSKVVEKAGPVVNFGDDSKGYTMGYGCLETDNVIIEEISLVEGLMHILLSISQFCDKGCEVLFKKEKCLISNQKNEMLTLNGVRKGDLFVAD
ncbi:hypothetical protein AgCh_028737 [Apium graveolens]